MEQRGVVRHGRAVQRKIAREGAPPRPRPSFEPSEPAGQAPPQQPRGQVERQVQRDLPGLEPIAATRDDDEAVVGLFDRVDPRGGAEIAAERCEPLAQALCQSLHAASGAGQSAAVRLQTCGGVGERHGLRTCLGGILQEHRHQGAERPVARESRQTKDILRRDESEARRGQPRRSQRAEVIQHVDRGAERESRDPGARA
ncbi:MAG: hypothetical protein U0835_07285 [Isosphaeraceae bacterium]